MCDYACSLGEKTEVRNISNKERIWGIIVSSAHLWLASNPFQTKGLLQEIRA